MALGPDVIRPKCPTTVAEMLTEEAECGERVRMINDGFGSISYGEPAVTSTIAKLRPSAVLKLLSKPPSAKRVRRNARLFDAKKRVFSGSVL